VFDRTLLRAGETVSISISFSAETTKGLAYLEANELPRA
jgi:hypothetical protein